MSIHKWFFAQSAGGGQVSALVPWNAEPIPLGLCSKNFGKGVSGMIKFLLEAV